MTIVGPVLLFLIFTALSMTGAYLVLAHHRGRRAGVWAAVWTGLFFALLGGGLVALLRSAGLS